jgi:hypothetical protein
MNRIFFFFSTSAVMRSLGSNPPPTVRSRPWTQAPEGSATWIQTSRDRLRAAETSAVKSLRPLDRTNDEVSQWLAAEGALAQVEIALGIPLVGAAIAEDEKQADDDGKERDDAVAEPQREVIEASGSSCEH